jgi:NitT/TauT family transport system permease protein/putative hydroxymethylpyrimidine transport system permease protein
VKRLLAPLAILVALIGLWELAARVLGVANYLLPAPSEVATALWDDRDLLAPDAWVTLREVVLGFGVALAAGLGFAALLHLSPALRRSLYPLLVASQTVPIIVVAPILVVWFGFGIAPKLGIIALICFFPITVNALDGLRSVDPDLIRLMRTLDASRWQILRRVEAPAALPFAFSGAKIAVAVAVIGAVFGEWAGSDSGLGHLMLQASAQLLTARMFAAVVVLSVFAVGLFALLALVERLVVTWSPGEVQ